MCFKSSTHIFKNNISLTFYFIALNLSFKSGNVPNYTKKTYTVYLFFYVYMFILHFYYILLVYWPECKTSIMLNTKQLKANGSKSILMRIHLDIFKCFFQLLNKIHLAYFYVSCFGAGWSLFRASPEDLRNP